MAGGNTILDGNGEGHLDEHILVCQAGVVFAVDTLNTVSLSVKSSNNAILRHHHSHHH